MIDYIWELIKKLCVPIKYKDYSITRLVTLEMNKKTCSNSTQINIGNIKITNDNGQFENDFKWFCSNNYKITEGNYGMSYKPSEDNDILNGYIHSGLPYPPDKKWNYIVNTSKVIKFKKINLKKASKDLMNLDVFYDENTIVEFYRKYGPLGLMPYYTNRTSNGKSNPIVDLMLDGNVKPFFNGNLQYTNYWPIMFNLHEQLVYDIALDFLDDRTNNRFINEFNSFCSKDIYLNYSEPLWLAEYVIKNFQLYCRTLIKNKRDFEAFYRANCGVTSAGYNHSEYYNSFNYFNEAIKEDIKIIPNLDDVNEIQFYAQSNSLFHAILAFTIFNYKCMVLGKCKNPTCLNLFWKDHNRSEYCSSACRSTVGGRKQREMLVEKAGEYIQRKYRNSHIPTKEIFESEKDKVIKEFGKSVLDVFNKKRINEWLKRK